MIPECDKTISGTVRTSTILIAAGWKEPEMYRSLEEVPGPMRRLLTECTEGENSGTIWIADQRGREEMGRSLGPPPADKLRRPSIALVWLWMVAVLLAGACFTILRNHL